MTAISLMLPDDLADEARRVAERAGLSRSEFIRSAVKHEVEALKAQFAREEMCRAFRHMREDPCYVSESEAIDEGLSELLTSEDEGWWLG